MGGGAARLDGALAGTTFAEMIIRLLSIAALAISFAVTAPAAIVAASGLFPAAAV